MPVEPITPITAEQVRLLGDQLLIDGLRAMGYTSTTSPAAQTAADQQAAASPASAVEPSAPPAPPPRPARQQPAAVTIGVDPTQVQPRAASPALNSLIRGAGRRPDQG